MKKWILLIWVMGPCGFGESAKEVIAFHLPCESKNSCEKMKTSEGKEIELDPIPKMVLTSENVADAFIGSGSQEKVINITLTEEAGKTFSDLTERNVLKPLAIIFRGQVLMAPVIRQKISGGRLMIENGVGQNKMNLLEEIPWLKEKTLKAKVNETIKADRDLWLYVGISVLVIGGTLAFGFLRKQS